MHTARDFVSLAEVTWKKTRINTQFAIFLPKRGEEEQEASFWVRVAQQSWELLLSLPLCN